MKKALFFLFSFCGTSKSKILFASLITIFFGDARLKGNTNEK